MFELEWMPAALDVFQELERSAHQTQGKGKAKSSLQEGLFKQVVKTLKLLRENPRHPGLQTHPYSSFPHPWDVKQKVFEAYVQNNTPGAYRIFWCYGKNRHILVILAITPYP
jgi:hypothetical protein